MGNTDNYRKKTLMAETNALEEIQTMNYISIFKGYFNYRSLDIDVKPKICHTYFRQLILQLILIIQNCFDY